ncbi:3-oxoacyl-ACP synthase [bacterium SCN 62-11]|nr:ketoacyl-ACP synthase III [Candidatus Eremiobacteraeota bacterium]ODT80536.1 MAG: 3-oxoacyl-ACP synthase [bacterium SCN 62-11]
MTTEELNSPQGYKTPVGILGVGHFVPEEIVTNADLTKFVDTSDEWIVSRTGIRARRRAAPHQATSDLAVEAGRRALQAAGTRAEDLDLIIVATMTPDCPMPATSTMVQHQLGATRAGGFDLNIACSGFVYALITGAQFVASGTFRRVLVIGADCMTRLMNWKDRSTCVLFGDGAGAVVLGPVEPGYGIVGIHAGVNGAGGPSLTVNAGGSRMPSWSEGVDSSDYYLQMEGPEVFRFAVSVMGEAAIKALENGGFTPDQVSLFIPHQANARIIEASRKRLNLPHERVFSNVEHYGNTSCGSVPLALSEALEQGRIQDGDLIALVGFGGGLSWASAAIRWGGKKES